MTTEEQLRAYYGLPSSIRDHAVGVQHLDKGNPAARPESLGRTLAKSVDGSRWPALYFVGLRSYCSGPRGKRPNPVTSFYQPEAVGKATTAASFFANLARSGPSLQLETWDLN